MCARKEMRLHEATADVNQFKSDIHFTACLEALNSAVLLTQFLHEIVSVIDMSLANLM